VASRAIARTSGWGRQHRSRRIAHAPILEALARLPAQASDRFVLAAKLLPKLFPDDKASLTLTHPAQWAESQKRLDRIDKEGLAEDLEHRTC
jgi:hypothetical protein